MQTRYEILQPVRHNFFHSCERAGGLGNIGVKKDGFPLLIVHLNVRCRHVSVNTRTLVVTIVVVIDEIKLKKS